jgi:hypothetical protein
LFNNRSKATGSAFERGAAIRAPLAEISHNTQGMRTPPLDSPIQAALRLGKRFARLSSRPRSRFNATSDGGSRAPEELGLAHLHSRDRGQESSRFGL